MKTAHDRSVRGLETLPRDAASDLERFFDGGSAGGCSAENATAAPLGNPQKTPANGRYGHRPLPGRVGLDDDERHRLISSSRYRTPHPASGDGCRDVPPPPGREIEGGVVALNGPLRSSSDPGAMDMTDTRLDPARGLIRGLGLGIMMWGVIGLLIHWLV